MMKKNKEKEYRKKLKKQKHHIKKFHDVYEFVDIKEVNNSYIKINDHQYALGIKIIPPKLSMLDEKDIARCVLMYNQVLNNTEFEIYHLPIKTPINIDVETNELKRLIAKETDPTRIAMLYNELENYETIALNNLKSEFFEMVVGDVNNKFFLKKLDDFVASYETAGFNIGILNIIDFENLLAYVFENETINDFYLSRGIFEEIEKEGESNV